MPRWSVVTVLPGEGLEDIAARFGVGLDELRSLNPGVELHPRWGTRVRVKAAHFEEERFLWSFKTKRVVTVDWLARHYHMDRGAIRLLNHLGRRRRRIPAGRRVRLYIPKSMWKGGYLDGGVQLHDGPGLKVKHPQWAWGRPVTVRTLEEVGRAIAQAFPGTMLVVGDLSRKGGGRFPPHSSHREGYDADICIYRVGLPWKEHFDILKPDQLDARRTWWLAHRLIESGRVEKILLDWHLQKVLYEEAKKQGATQEELKKWFQYPRSAHARAGMIRHYRGHRNHMHVRFHEVEGQAIL